MRALRETESRTPVVLMGYLNPILRHGVAAFARDAGEAGVDGLILVDLPLEHAGEIDRQLREHGMHLIRMSAPTSEDSRLADTLRDAGGFVYHHAGRHDRGRAAGRDRIARALAKVRAHTGLPVAAGFGVRTPKQARVVGRHADLVAVGSRLAEVLAERGVPGALEEVRLLAGALRQ